MSKENEAQDIVRRHMYWSMGLGLVPIPLLDLAAVSGVQLRMLSHLSNLYDRPFSEDVGKSMVTSLLGSLVPGRLVCTRLVSMFYALPLVRFIGFPALAGASTYAIGKVFVKHFESGGDLLSLNMEKAKASASRVFKRKKEELEEEPKPKGKGAKK